MPRPHKKSPYLYELIKIPAIITKSLVTNPKTLKTYLSAH
ncbi:MAG: hypothetical protein ACJAXX_000520 [Roseivirga sp.]